MALANSGMIRARVRCLRILEISSLIPEACAGDRTEAGSLIRVWFTLGVPPNTDEIMVHVQREREREIEDDVTLVDFRKLIFLATARVRTRVMLNLRYVLACMCARIPSSFYVWQLLVVPWGYWHFSLHLSIALAELLSLFVSFALHLPMKYWPGFYTLGISTLHVNGLAISVLNDLFGFSEFIVCPRICAQRWRIPRSPQTRVYVCTCCNYSIRIIHVRWPTGDSM